MVITLSLRTPLTKARKGGFKDTDLDYLVYALLKEVIAKSQIDPALVEDVCLGNVRSTLTFGPVFAFCIYVYMVYEVVIANADVM